MGYSLLLDGSIYFCFVVSLDFILRIFPRRVSVACGERCHASRHSWRPERRGSRRFIPDVAGVDGVETDGFGADGAGANGAGAVGYRSRFIHHLINGGLPDSERHARPISQTSTAMSKAKTLRIGRSWAQPM